MPKIGALKITSPLENKIKKQREWNNNLRLEQGGTYTDFNRMFSNPTTFNTCGVLETNLGANSTGTLHLRTMWLG